MQRYADFHLDLEAGQRALLRRGRQVSFLRGLLGALLALALGLGVAPGAVLADGGDFSLDFSASSPESYDHRMGGGAYDDRTIGVDVTESLEGEDFTCGDLVTFLTAIAVDDQVTDATQVIEIDLTFLADTTGQPGAAYADIANVQVNYGPVEAGDGLGGTDSGIQDDGGSTAFLVAEGLVGSLFVAGSELQGTVRVDDLEAGERVILRTDARIVCQPGSNPTGNLHAQLESARVVEPSADAISGGSQTISVKKVGDLLFPALTIQKTVTTADGTCPGQETLRVASGDTVKYCYEVANFGTQPLLNLSAIDDNATPGDSSDDLAIVFSGLTDGDSDGNADDVAPLEYATGEATRLIDLPVGSIITNRVTATGDEVAPVWDVATVRVTDLPPGLCSVSVTASLDGGCPGVEVVNVLQGTLVTWCYEVQNDTAHGLLGVGVSDNTLGDLGSVGDIAAGASAGTSTDNVEWEDALRQASAAGVDVFGNPRTCAPDDAAVNVVRPGINVDKTVIESGSCPGSDSLALIAGNDVVYCYEIFNIGDTTVASVAVGDDKLGAIGSAGAIGTGQSTMLSSDPVQILDDVTNVATVTGVDEYGFPVADQDIAIIDALAADLEVQKSGPGSVNREETNLVDYAVTVTNLGDIPAEDVVLSDPLPADFIYASHEPSDLCSYDGVEVTCSFETLLPGGSASVTIHGTVDILFGVLDNEACATTPSPEIELGNNCDTLRTKVAPGDTRSQGYYGNHPAAVEACFAFNGGVIDLGFIALQDENFDDQVDSTRGPDLDCEIDRALEMAMGIYNSSASHYNDGASRSDLDQARMAAARQVLTAWCNTTWLDTDGGLDFDAIRAVLAGTDIDALHAVQSLTNTFNLSGDGFPMTQEGGPTDSSYPWDDPTDPYDPNDAFDLTDPRCYSEWDLPTSCGLGVEIALLLPPILWLRRRVRKGR